MDIYYYGYYYYYYYYLLLLILIVKVVLKMQHTPHKNAPHMLKFCNFAHFSLLILIAKMCYDAYELCIVSGLH